MSDSYSKKLKAGHPFPEIIVKSLDGQDIKLGTPSGDSDWQMVIVYRGRHCPMCTRQLNSMAVQRDALAKIGIDLVAVSGDSKEQLEEHQSRLITNYPLYYGLTQEQMETLGYYISYPRSEKETDHNFAEPALFVVNQDGNIQVVDYSNNPFVRPDIERLVSGLQWIRNPDNNYPIRGTVEY